MGGGDAGFGVWNRARPGFGNGTFLVARAAFYIVGQDTVGLDAVADLPADATPLSGLVNPRYWPLLPRLAAVVASLVHSTL